MVRWVWVCGSGEENKFNLCMEGCEERREGLKTRQTCHY